MGDIERALEQCASEPVHIPGSIQGHGALIAFDNESLRLTHASKNLEAVAGLACEEVLGQSINEVFPSGVRHDMVNSLLPSFLKQDTRLLDPVTLGQTILLASTAAAGSATIFEFETAENRASMSGDALKQLAFSTARLQNVDDFDSLFKLAVQLLQVLTGYQRVMVYEFDGEGNGTIRAEALSGGLDSLLGLNFPAWDIPAQARAIMARVPFRYIADVNAPNVPVLAADDRIPPLDMTQSHLRGVSSVHMEYLRNMGTEATFTLNVVVNDELWGMIALHHPRPRVPEQSVREVCRNFVRFFGLKLATMLQQDRLDRLRQANVLRAELTNVAASGDADIRFSTQLLEQLANAMQADGALIVKDGFVQSHGVVPPSTAVRELMTFSNAQVEPISTAGLNKDYPELVFAFGAGISGMHLTPIRKDNLVAFFRRDREQMTTWAGVPEKQVVGTGADARLRPRGSFAAYKETVRGTSAAWTQEQDRIASDVWSILINSEHKALIEKTARQQKMLINELNHRVRNLLTLIRSLSRQSRATSHSIDDYVDTLEARIEAVANAHSLAVEEPEALVSVQSILRQEASAHSGQSDRVRIAGPKVGLQPEVTPIFALVIHELMTNATKYGSLSVPGGSLDIEIVLHKGRVKLHWTEHGGPAVTPPTRTGFGSTLLDNAVPKDLRGTIQRDYAKDGFQCVLELPSALITDTVYPSEVPHDIVSKGADWSDTLGDRAKASCLLVEDNFVVSMDTLATLNSVGFENVQTASSSRDALQAIKQMVPDFVVLDVNLSGGDSSLSIAEELQALGARFVFVTGYGVEGVPRDQFPNTPVLQKPMRKSALNDALTELRL
ncbi:GAF domain-containing protein [Tateyamaria omphalii]|uniref:HWE histidine kinase domain-containing protein n=1 Tax=Tateyamaria omphalii TaxID=299262 RepID=UPI001C9984F8|nr:HWE histidine kinase domain-containing protein [Tateyamaria omphalii]MBY5933945.1 GAF domain-containing protein [Tateyamaria omphalii]